MLEEFKEFAVKGNMVDMAVGIIIGAAFGTMVKSVVAFLIVAFVLFIVVRNMNRLMAEKEEAAKEETPPEPTTQEVLLTEIRDLLESQARRGA